MARPPKKGLDYFNIDCRLTDEIKYLIAKHGPEGYGIFVLLQKKCYETEGYYAPWTEKNLFLFATEIGSDVEKVRVVLKTCLRENLFAEKLYLDFQVLTSQDIQERFLHIVTNSKRKDTRIEERFNLLSDGSLRDKLEFTPEETFKTPEETPQIKGKDIKEKESNISPGPDGPGPESQGDKEKEKERFYKALDPRDRGDKKYLVRFIRSQRPTFIEPYFDLWNIFAKETGLPQVQKISESRRRKFAVRIREKDFDFENILRKAKESAFVRSGRWFGWDWILENDKNYLKVLEGNYDGANPEKPAAGAGPKKPSNHSEELAYLIGREEEGQLDPQFINLELYDFMVARSFIPVGVLQNFPGNTDNERKLAGILDYIKKHAKTVK